MQNASKTLLLITLIPLQGKKGKGKGKGKRRRGRKGKGGRRRPGKGKGKGKGRPVSEETESVGLPVKYFSLNEKSLQLQIYSYWSKMPR